MTHGFTRLELRTYEVKEVTFGEKNVFRDGVLSIEKKEVQEFLSRDTRFRRVDLDIARPGEPVRIIHVLDVIEPRAKSRGPLRIFPGFLGPPATVGRGVTHRLKNVAVMTTADIQAMKSYGGPSSVSGQRERIVDMAGEASAFSPFSETINVVLNAEPSSGTSAQEFDDAMRRAGLGVAEYLAKLTENLVPDHIDFLATEKPHSSLPKIAYICLVQSGPFLRETYLYGECPPYWAPTLVHPNETADGAMVNGSLSYASTPTYVHQNNKVMGGLLKRHGKELDFVGVIVSSRHPLTHQDKMRRAGYAAKLAKMLGAEGAILTQEGGGNSIVDQMLTAQSCEELGIKTGVVTLEMGGVEGKDFPLIYQVKEADAVVSTGNREAMVRMPRMKRASGGTHILYKGIPATESFETHMSDIAFSFEQTGFWKIRAEDY
jgi:sarcosine reductase